MPIYKLTTVQTYKFDILMLRSIFFKEWLKTRIAVAAILVVSLGLCAYLLLSTHQLLQSHGIMPVWDTLLSRDTLLLEWLEFVPLIAGVLLGCCQMLPEMLQKRIKLTLHLPIANGKAIGAMELYGIAVMVGLAATNLGLCYGVMAIWLPREMLQHIFLTVAVWYLAGIQAYLFTTWVILEPTWKMRMAELLFAGVCLRMFYISTMPETYNAFLPLLCAFTLLFCGLPLLSIERFKEGKGL